MAVDLHMLEMEAIEEGGEENRTEPATTTADGGDRRETAVVYRKGAWSEEEDEKLRMAVDKYGLRNWVAVEKFSGLGRPAKNCRLRWLNYLRPNLKKYPFTQEEEDLIFQLHSKYGNSWSRIASQLPGRSDNEIKNFWHKKAKKRNQNTLSSTLIHSPQIQPSTPNVIHMSSRLSDASVQSPQTQFRNSSPASSHIRQSPTNHLTDQTTPTSQIQNLLLSPNSRTRSTGVPFLIPNASPYIHAPCTGQSGANANEFTVRRETPILSSPQGFLRRFSRPTTTLSPNSPCSDISNGSNFIPQDSPQIRLLSSIESPGSPLKLKLSPRVPTHCSLQMEAQSTDPQVASFHDFRLQSPNKTPLSPLKLRLSTPIPTKTNFQSNLSVPVQTNSSTTLVASVSYLKLNPSSCDLPPFEPLIVETGNIIPPDSSQTIKIEPHSVEVKYDSSSEIMEELREAQAKVKFLRKKLSSRRTSNKKRLYRGSSGNGSIQRLLDGDSSESTTKGCALRTSLETKKVTDDILRVKPPLKNSKKKDMLEIFPRRKKIENTTSASGENSLCKLQKKGHSENEKCKQRRVKSTKETRDENIEIKTMSHENLHEEHEYSLGEIFRRENSMTFNEQRHSRGFVDHLNILNIVNPPNSNPNSFDNKMCNFQGSARKCLYKCSTIDGLHMQSSNILQNNTLHGDLFGHTSEVDGQLSTHMHLPLVDGYNKCTAVELGDDVVRMNYLQSDQGEELFDYNFGLEVSDIPERKNKKDCSIDDNESSLLQKQNHASTPNSLDSSYLMSAPIMEQEYFPSEESCLQRFGDRNLANSSKICERNMLRHHLPSSSAANLIDNLVDSGYLVDFEQECPHGSEQYFFESFVSEFDKNDTKIERCREQTLMQSLMADNLWSEDQLVSHNDTFSTNKIHSDVFDIMEPKNWNYESGCRHTGDVSKQHGEHDHMNTISEELSNLLDFFPTTNGSPEWYNITNAIHDTKASNEFDMSFDLQSSSTSQMPLTTADYL